MQEKKKKKEKNHTTEHPIHRIMLHLFTWPATIERSHKYWKRQWLSHLHISKSTTILGINVFHYSKLFQLSDKIGKYISTKLYQNLKRQTQTEEYVRVDFLREEIEKKIILDIFVASASWKLSAVDPLKMDINISYLDRHI